MAEPLRLARHVFLTGEKQVGKSTLLRRLIESLHLHCAGFETRLLTMDGLRRGEEPVEGFVHNGTTYLPVRAVSQALGENVTWDSESNSVFVGEHAATGAPAGSLYELDYFSSENLATGRTDCLVRETVEDNLGAAHDTTRFRGWSGSEDTTVTYKLNGRYSRLTGVYFLPFSDRDTTTTYAAALYADGEQVWSGSVTGGVEPISIDVDLTGVQELKLVMHQNAVYAPSIYYYFGDLTLFA